MNDSMNDWEELRQRAEEAKEEAEETGEPVVVATQQPQSLFTLDSLNVIRERGQPISRGRVVDQRRPGMDEEIARATQNAWESLRNIALENQTEWRVLCGICGESKVLGQSCVCETSNPNLFGTVSGRLSSSSSGISNIPRTLEETSTSRMLRGEDAYLRSEHSLGCPCMGCQHGGPLRNRNLAHIRCDICNEEFHINRALVMDGRYTCRRCREENMVQQPVQERCSICDNTRTVALRPEGRPVCPDCVTAGRHRRNQAPAAAGGYVYQVRCRHCNGATNFGTLALASRSMRDLAGTCVACGHYALGIEEIRANHPSLDAERRREREAAAQRALVAREMARAAIPEPNRPTFTRADDESPEEQRRRIRRDQLASNVRMAQATGRDASAFQRELDVMNKEDIPVENFVPKRKVELD
jgi:hypothetical protein